MSVIVLNFFALQAIPSVFRSFFTVICGPGQYKGPKYPSHPYPLSLSNSLSLLVRAAGAELARARPRRPAGAELASPPRALRQIHGEDRLRQLHARRLLALAAATNGAATGSPSRVRVRRLPVRGHARRPAVPPRKSGVSVGGNRERVHD